MAHGAFRNALKSQWKDLKPGQKGALIGASLGLIGGPLGAAYFGALGFCIATHDPNDHRPGWGGCGNSWNGGG